MNKQLACNTEMNRNVRQCTIGHVRPAEIQVCLRTHAAWSESHWAHVWLAKDAMFLHADNRAFDQTARMSIILVEWLRYLVVTWCITCPQLGVRPWTNIVTVFTICIRTDRPEQTVEARMRRRITRRLIWVYTVCHSSSNFMTQQRVVNCTGSNFRTYMVRSWSVRILRVNTVFFMLIWIGDI